MTYPIGDVLLVALAVAAMFRARHPWQTPLPLVCAGLAAIAASDAAFAYLTQVRHYSTGTLIDAGWVAGYALLGLAALRPSSPPAPRVERPVTAATATMLYLPVAVGLIVTTGRVLDGHALDPVLWTIGVVTVAIIVVRQIVAVSDNAALNRTLENRVRARTAELATERERFRSLVQHSSDITLVVDRAGTITFTSTNVWDALGRDPASLAGTPLDDLVHPDDRDAAAGALLLATVPGNHDARADWRMTSRTGDWRAYEAALTDHVADPAIGGVIINARDVSDRRQLEDELRHQAFHDPLTGLANRVLFSDRINHALVRADRDPGAPAVLFLDLDDFKSVNDTAGHAAGDALLRQIAHRITTAVRASDTVARFGGDEFAVLVETIDDADQPLRIARRIQAAIAAPTDIGEREVMPRVSIGVAFTDADGSTADDLLRHADIAMYVAKSDGKGTIRTYDDATGHRVIERLALQSELPAAIEHGELVVHYQPLVELTTQRLVGMEALVRWQHPTRGLIAPDAFIPAAEASGLIVDIGRHVLITACTEAAGWLVHRPDLELSVNLSPRELTRPGLADDVIAIVDACGFPAANLVLEITESVVLGDGPVVSRALEQLTGHGIRLAIDDFGTGYSSFSYVSELPVHALKIDRSFIAALARGGHGRTIIETIVHLANDLGLDTIAEGIETSDAAELLAATGCHLGQGYLYARPLTPTEFNELVTVDTTLSSTTSDAL